MGTDEHATADAFAPVAPTAKEAARSRVLLEAERLVADTHRSGVRMAAAAPLPHDFSFDPHNAVTKVQEAINLDAFLPPTLEVTVAVSETIAVTRPPLATPAETLEEPMPEAPLPRVPRWRRVLAALLVLLVMGAATALLVTAALRIPGVRARVSSVVHLVR